MTHPALSTFMFLLFYFPLQVNSAKCFPATGVLVIAAEAIH